MLLIKHLDHMSTISVPLSADLEKSLNALVKSGYGSNKADVIRRALRKVTEEETIEKILRAQKEPSLKGNLRELANKFK
jgi:Arc/MetJ-type ribon-helix-helix transcriptional regulator